MTEKEKREPTAREQTLSYMVRGMHTVYCLTRTEHRAIFQAFCVLVCVEALGLCVPLLFRGVIDTLPLVVQHGLEKGVVILAGGMLGAQLLALILRRFVQEKLFLPALCRLEKLWPTQALEKLLALSVAFHARTNTGRSVAKTLKGVERAVNMVANTFWTLLPALCYLLINLCVIAVLDWRLALLFLPPLFLAIQIHLASYRALHDGWAHYEVLREGSVGRFAQAIMGVRTVQHHAQEEREAMRFGQVRQEMCALDIGFSLRAQKYLFSAEAVLILSFVCIVLVGTYFAYREWTTVGTVTYLFITGNATIQNMWSVMQTYTRMLRDLVAVDRFATLLQESDEVPDAGKGNTPPPLAQGIAFVHISLVYQGKEAPAVHELSLTFPAGRMTALVGPSGAGKSTMAGLLVRECDPTGGAVFWEGKDYRTLDRSALRSRFAIVPQEVDLLDGTVWENIAYPHPEVSEGVVKEAVRVACLTECFADKKRFPEGLCTGVGERGVRLSGGERQRVGIARAYVALMRGAQVLVLDEATASLDSLSERAIQDFVRTMRTERGLTVVVIAHRLSTVREADCICVLENGSVSEQGTHEQLMRGNGLYARLVALQELGALRE